MAGVTEPGDPVAAAARPPSRAAGAARSGPGGNPRRSRVRASRCPWVGGSGSMPPVPTRETRQPRPTRRPLTSYGVNKRRVDVVRRQQATGRRFVGGGRGHGGANPRRGHGDTGVHRNGDDAAAPRTVHRAHRPELPAPRATGLPGQGLLVPPPHGAEPAARRPAGAGPRAALAPARRPLRPGGPARSSIASCRSSRRRRPRDGCGGGLRRRRRDVHVGVDLNARLRGTSG